MKKISVLQGVMSPQGNGDMNIIKTFASVKEARAFFEDIKKDKRGWSIPKGYKLVTELLVDDDENEDFYDVRELYEI